jgi:hypothetical protein
MVSDPVATDVHDHIREVLTARASSSKFLRHSQASSAISAVLDLHSPMRIFDECGHDHQADEPGVRDIDEIGLVCEEAYSFTICRHCCAWEYGQTEACASNHSLTDCYPCRTIQVIAEQLGVVDGADPSGGQHG